MDLQETSRGLVFSLGFAFVLPLFLRKDGAGAGGYRGDGGDHSDSGNTLMSAKKEKTQINHLGCVPLSSPSHEANTRSPQEPPAKAKIA